MKKILKFISQHKFISGIIIIVIAGGVYWRYKARQAKSAAELRYVLGTVEKGTLITSVSGSGQISVSNQVDVKPKVSGDVLEVLVKNGQEVKQGDTLVRIDDADARKSIRDAETNLASARLSLEKLKQPTDAYTLMQAMNSLTNARVSLEKLKEPADEYDLMQALNSLTNAKDTLEKLKLSQETDYQKVLETKQKAEDNIIKSYEDAFNGIANGFLDLPGIITELNDILYSEEIGNSESTVGGRKFNVDALMSVMDVEEMRVKLKTFQESAERDYKIARLKYDENFEKYKSATRYSEQSIIETLLAQTLETTKAMAQSAKSESNYLDVWVDYRSGQNKTIFVKVLEYQGNLATYIGKTNNHLSSLLSVQRSIEDYREALANAQRDLKEMEQNNPLDIASAEASIKEKEASLEKLKAGADETDIASAEASVKEKESSLEKLKAGPDPLDIRSQEIAIAQKKNTLLDAQQKLADYNVVSPIDGVIAQIDLKKKDNLSSGSVAATVITKQKMAEVSLNEVDAAKVKPGQKVTLTFDAVSDLSITGAVAEIDALGTVSQGVVTYNVKIVFDTQDDRIKPGMSVSASIITQVRADVLLVANSAFKTAGNSHYVEILDNIADADKATAVRNAGITSAVLPKQLPVEIGLANDTMTEIISGLNEKDLVILRTVNSSTTAAQSQGQSILQMGRSGGSGGNVMRMGR